MQLTEMITTPGDLLMLALGFGVAGAALCGLAALIMKLTGIDINEYARETNRYRNAGFAEQSAAFYSDKRNIPVQIMFGGLLLIFGAVVSSVVAGGWFLLRLFYV